MVSQLIMMLGFVRIKDLESYASSSIALVEPPMLDKSKGRYQTKKATLGLLVGGCVEGW
jgi:hypothetical protein